ncbi:lysophospholipid acyltransferase family protein [Oceanibaculum nanhaiense]|uniref:lysophospholipid acyltransferase family protein n=1 Tax=Oceanibaculum nanhaiense TaxID=1909734 RepID=UPI00396E5F79
MRPLKKLLRRPPVHRLLCRLASSYMRFAAWTTRWEVLNDGPLQEYLRQGQPFIVCLWHGRMMIVPHAWPPGHAINVLISRHGDGRFISTVIGHIGMGTIEGSTSQGAVSALRAIIRSLRAGRVVAITPDGPRGPRMRAASGVAMAATVAKVPVLPIAAAVSHCRILGSWDRFILPLPFVRGVVVWGEPILLPTETGQDAIEAGRQRIEEALIRLSAEADRRMGHTPIEPAPLPESKPEPEPEPAP